MLYSFPALPFTAHFSLQKGFAVPATAQSAPPRGANGVHKEAGDFASPRGRVGPSGSGPSQTNKKLTVLEDIPDVTDPDEIKKAVDERLLRFNEGQVVEIKKPSSGRTYGMTIEVDCHQSAQYLVNNGLYINGRQVRFHQSVAVLLSCVRIFLIMDFCVVLF